MSTRDIYAKSHLMNGGLMMVAGEGFEPSKAEPGDLQSLPLAARATRQGRTSTAAIMVWSKLKQNTSIFDG